MGTPWLPFPGCYPLNKTNISTETLDFRAVSFSLL